MKKTNYVLAASLVALLSACGKKEAPPPAEPAPPPVTTAPAAPTPPPVSEPPAAPTTPAAPPPTSEAPAATAPTATAAGTVDGASVYNKVCAMCHAAGVAGAPKPGDKADWGPRIAQGKDLLYKHALEGFTGQKGMMPPRGGGTSLTDDEVKAAVDHMVAKSS